MSHLVWEEIPNVSVHALGPYILYAKPLYTYPKLQRLKRRLGKTLLFFPVHASSDCKMPFDAHEAIRRLQVLKKQYDFRTVLVCMYYMNLQQGEHLPYLQAGFQVVKPDPLPAPSPESDPPHPRRRRTPLSAPVGQYDPHLADDASS